MAEIVADAADGRAAGGIVDAAGAVEGLVAAGGIVDVAGLVGGGTKNLRHGSTRIHTDKPKATTRVVAFFRSWLVIELSS